MRVGSGRKCVKLRFLEPLELTIIGIIGISLFIDSSWILHGSFIETSCGFPELGVPPVIHFNVGFSLNPLFGDSPMAMGPPLDSPRCSRIRSTSSRRRTCPTRSATTQTMMAFKWMREAGGRMAIHDPKRGVKTVKTVKRYGKSRNFAIIIDDGPERIAGW